jgi:hypothetical protein
MKIKEITSTQPKTVEQQRLDTLKATKEKAADAVTQERLRQQTATAQKALGSTSNIASSITKPNKSSL